MTEATPVPYPSRRELRAMYAEEARREQEDTVPEPRAEPVPLDEPVVVGHSGPVEPEKKPSIKTLPKWEQDARAALKAAMKRFTKPLEDLIARDANEGDTRLLVTDFLCEALGYDKYADLTTEYAVRGEFADYGVRIAKELVAFIEVKRCTTKLNLRHLRQVEMYAVNEGVEWMILTNGRVWQVYHLTGGLPMVVDLALEVDLLDDSPASDKVAALFYLARESLRRRLIDDLWKVRAATSPKSLGDVIASEPVVEMVRRELRKRTGHLVPMEELTRLICETVLAPYAK